MDESVVTHLCGFILLDKKLMNEREKIRWSEDKNLFLNNALCCSKNSDTYLELKFSQLLGLLRVTSFAFDRL